MQTRFQNLVLKRTKTIFFRNSDAVKIGASSVDRHQMALMSVKFSGKVAAVLPPCSTLSY